ncbi:hypothetical protein [Kribbella monticola]|uniref:hypothetical protein n=1 Tax=Kribbella monticola TaxID=2185285 RepID=UPI0013008165|nr:hypothetical protein [Kribbella monticola]
MVEDEIDIAHLKAAELLKAEPSLAITHAHDPRQASRYLQSEQFDVVVTDLSFRDERNLYTERIKAGKVSLTSDTTFLSSGLQVISDARKYSRRPGLNRGSGPVRPGIVVWTIMDENRTLQVFYAHEKLGVRSFCSKSAPAVPRTSGSETGSLLGAIRKAYDNRAYADAIIQPCLPLDQSIHDTIFKDPKWYGVWRMFALGISREQNVIKGLGLNVQRINGYTGAMYDQIKILHSLSERNNSGPVSVVYSYAQMHWEFFLDQVVMRRYPPDGHPWAKLQEPSND